MPKVSDEVAHILKHVEAEAKDSDPSQAPGMATRAQKVRDMLESLKTDQRDLTRKQLIVELRGTGDAGVKEMLDAIDADDPYSNLRMWISEWVGKGSAALPGK